MTKPGRFAPGSYPGRLPHGDRVICTETAYAKINLALHVRARRADGYHEIETLFAFCEDGDTLTAGAADIFTLRIDAPPGVVLSTGDDNLVLRAARALSEATGTRSGAHLHLQKRIPVAAGLGGGSADAAATLRLLSRLWRIEVCDTLLIRIATELGADVAACIASHTARGTGIGEQLDEANFPEIAGTPLLLVNPGIACPTGAIFQGWPGIDRGPLTDWRDGRNDLEEVAASLFPAIRDVLAALSEKPGATFCRMSGSGASCFALFDEIESRDAAQNQIVSAHPNWWTMASRLRR